MTTPRFTIGVSLKMYFSHAQTLEWSRAVAAICARHPAVVSGVVEVFVIPTYPSISAVVEIMSPNPVGAQDLAVADRGPFTGEVSGAELAEIGCRMVEVGHAERRRLFGETDDIVSAKTAAALRNGLVPIVCVGEAQRSDSGSAVAECVRQAEGALEMARTAGHHGRVLLAYEPHWAIGASEPAEPEHIRSVSSGLARAFRGDSQFPDVRVIYGGSAGPGLLPRIAEHVSGMFLGRFAHDPAVMAAVLDEAGEIERSWQRAGASTTWATSP